MEHTVEKISGNKVKISFKVAAERFEEAIEKAYLKMRGRINVPGFRKGKAPRKLIERMYGDMIFYDDALEIIFPDAYMTAINENDLKPVGRPELDVQEMEKGKDLAFTCEVFVHPDVKLGDLKGIEVTQVTREVSDDEVDAQIAQEQKRMARSVEISDRAVESGDLVNLDYSGSVDGVKFDGGTAEGQQLLIGSGSFIPGFEEQMIGMEIGSEGDLTVTFPEKYHSDELAGKEAVFHVKVNGISREELPELDDEFASEVSDFDTLQEYKADIKAKLQKVADEQSVDAAKQSLVEKVVELSEIDIPDPMVEEKLDDMMEQMAWRMQQQGFTMKQYQEITGQTDEQMRDMYREEAKNSLKSEMVLDEIVKTENLEADEAEVDKMLGDYGASMGQTVEQLKDMLTDAQKGYFTHRAKVQKALAMLWENAKVKVEAAEAKIAEKVEKTAKKAPAKKAAAKKETAKAETAKKAPTKKAASKVEESEKPKKTRKKSAEAGEEA